MIALHTARMIVLELTSDEFAYIRGLVSGQGRPSPRAKGGFTALDALALTEKLRKVKPVDTAPDASNMDASKGDTDV
jgi:hypothetical protein